jgi:hypothetical protein
MRPNVWRFEINQKNQGLCGILVKDAIQFFSAITACMEIHILQYFDKRINVKTLQRPLVRQFAFGVANKEVIIHKPNISLDADASGS